MTTIKVKPSERQIKIVMARYKKIIPPSATAKMLREDLKIVKAFPLAYDIGMAEALERLIKEKEGKK